MPSISSLEKDREEPTQEDESQQSSDAVKKEESEESRAKSKDEDFAKAVEQLDRPHFESENRAINLVTSLREFRAEFLQMKDTQDTEKKISKVISTFLGEYLPQVGKSYELDPSLFPSLQGVKQLTLTPQCIFFLTFQDGLKEARTLESLSPESLMKVLEEIVPVMMAHFRKKREKIAFRSIEFYRIAEELKEMPLSSSEKSSEKSSQ